MSSIGGTGIGAHLAETLALRNVQVVVLTKDPPRFESEHRELPRAVLDPAIDRAIERIHSYICDVSDRGQLMRLVERIGEEVRPLPVHA
jgi:all-trans-retinol dehydrogenase (NAD+)